VVSADSDGVAAFVRQANLPPVCTGVSTTAKPGGPTSISLSCSDANGDALTRALLTAPAHGDLGEIDDAAGAVEYTPAVAFAGTDTFTFRASDGLASSNPATASLNVPDVTAPDCTEPGALKARASRTLKSKQKLKQIVRKGRLRFKLSCSEPATVKAELVASRKLAKKLHVAAKKIVALGKGTKRITTANKVTTVKVKLKRKTRKKLRKVRAKSLRKLKLTLRITVTDGAGNQAKINRKLKFKR
jgi:hypothetical protein